MSSKARDLDLGPRVSPLYAETVSCKSQDIFSAAVDKAASVETKTNPARDKQRDRDRHRPNSVLLSNSIFPKPSFIPALPLV